MRKFNIAFYYQSYFTEVGTIKQLNIPKFVVKLSPKLLNSHLISAFTFWSHLKFSHHIPNSSQNHTWIGGSSGSYFGHFYIDFSKTCWFSLTRSPSFPCHKPLPSDFISFGNISVQFHCFGFRKVAIFGLRRSWLLCISFAISLKMMNFRITEV